MEINLQTWSQKTKAIFTGVLIYSIAGIVAGIFAGIGTASNTVSNLVAIAEGGTGGGINFFTILSYVFIACLIVGYVIFIMGLGNFRAILTPVDGDSIGKVRTGAILFVVASVWSLFGFMTWISVILNIIGAFMMLTGFMSLKNSPTFPAKARSGASNLFLAMLLSIIAYAVIFIFTWIPILGAIFTFIAGLLNLAAFILIILGWNAIKNADPTVF